jgi:hypothetical protein
MAETLAHEHIWLDNRAVGRIDIDSEERKIRVTIAEQPFGPRHQLGLGSCFTDGGTRWKRLARCAHGFTIVFRGVALDAEQGVGYQDWLRDLGFVLA